MYNSIDNNQINFSAKLILDKSMAKNPKWQNVAKLFEEKTKSSPNEILKFSMRDLEYDITHDSLTCNNDHGICFTDDGLNKLSAMKDTNIIEILKKILVICKERAAISEMIDRFIEQLCKRTGRDAPYHVLSSPHYCHPAEDIFTENFLEKNKELKEIVEYGWC
ncbi:hypothetical protein IKQ21_04665 [bacterium]|nr:hypothetical protein [bacterium]